MTAYEVGDPIEWRYSGGKWLTLGTYMATTSGGTVVCEGEGGQVHWADTETRLARDTITVTVEIDRAGAEAIVAHGGNPAAEDPPDRTEAFQAFIDAVTEAVES